MGVDHFLRTNAMKYDSLCSPRPDTNEGLFSSTNGELLHSSANQLQGHAHYTSPSASEPVTIERKRQI